MTTSTQQESRHGRQHQLTTAVDGDRNCSSAAHKPSSSTIATYPSTSDDATESMHTAMGEPMDETVHLDKLSIPNAIAMGHEVENPRRSAILAALGSSAEDQEGFEDGVASSLTQQEIGAQKSIGSELTLVSKRVPTPTPPQDMKSNLHEPPSELMPLPQKRATPLWRRVRHRLLAVYQRLFSVVFVGNAAAIVTVLILNRYSRPFGPSLDNVSSAVAANVMGAILIRQEYFINLLYSLFCWTPLWMPLRIRRIVAKFYHFGGVHSGCAVSAVAWFILYTVLVTKQYADDEDFRGSAVRTAVLCITYALLVLFLGITVFAIPRFRVVSHNTFEAIHRFGGWLAVGLFWVLLFLPNYVQSTLPASPSLGILTVQAPSFWLVLAVSLSIIVPWLRLRHVPVHAERLSSHAIRLHFTYIRKIGPVVGIRIATSPLKEWHAFATIPSANASSFSVLISDAGDWTRQQIANPASRYWVRGIPITGVLRMAAVFKRVIVVTTGSGIGPVLSMVVSSQRMATTRILWSTPDPLQTYGQGIVDAVCDADENAVIWNTRERGRPDMVALTYHMFKENQAEAVFVISNPKLTSKVVYAMEARGVPAFGPIWDS